MPARLRVSRWHSNAQDGNTALDWATGKADRGSRRPEAAGVLEADPRVGRGGQQVAAPGKDAVPLLS